MDWAARSEPVGDARAAPEPLVELNAAGIGVVPTEVHSEGGREEGANGEAAEGVIEPRVQVRELHTVGADARAAGADGVQVEVHAKAEIGLALGRQRREGWVDADVR